MSFKRFSLRLILTSLVALSPLGASAANVCTFSLHSVESESIEVHQSNDAGAYYCEHAFCINVQSAAYNPSIAKDANGEKLVGFLHVQPDEHIFSPGGTYNLGKRHQKTRFVMGTAIKGYFAALLDSMPAAEGYKILITGYEKFQSITNNPTGEFVKQQENIDAAMEVAFGSNHQRIGYGDGEIKYVVMVNGGYKLLSIGTLSLEVTDQAMNTALPQTIKDFNPNAIISMGMGRTHSSYVVEIRATDKGLSAGPNGFYSDRSSPITIENENYSLWTAIQNGSKK